jgi:hypothetical protein
MLVDEFNKSTSSLQFLIQISPSAAILGPGEGVGVGGEDRREQ